MREFEVLFVYNRDIDEKNDYHGILRVKAESSEQACEMVDQYKIDGMFENVEDDYIEDSLYSINVMSVEGHPIDVDKESKIALKRYHETLADESSKAKRKERLGNIDIGEFEAKLQEFNDDEEFVLSNGAKLDGDVDSYRGYYEDAYLGMSGVAKIHTVGDLRKVIENACFFGMMEGYKGGTFPIDKDTLLWVATYGNCGDKLVDVKRVDGVVTLMVEENI